MQNKQRLNKQTKKQKNQQQKKRKHNKTKKELNKKEPTFQGIDWKCSPTKLSHPTLICAFISLTLN